MTVEGAVSTEDEMFRHFADVVGDEAVVQALNYGRVAVEEGDEGIDFTNEDPFNREDVEPSTIVYAKVGRSTLSFTFANSVSGPCVIPVEQAEAILMARAYDE